MVLRLLLLLGVLTTLPAATLEERVAAVAESSVAARQGFWGAKVTDLATGQIVYEHNADKLFVPASNVKLFTTALALMKLGPEHRLRTRIVAATAPDDAGVIGGDLILAGGGDPTLSGREIPYRKGPSRGDPLGPFRELASQVIDAGVRRIDGDIVGDDTAYVWEPYPDGWAQEDLAWEYGAPVSALTLHDNAFRLSVLAGPRAGDPAKLVLKPPVEYYVIHNHVRTAASGEAAVFVDWPPTSQEIHLRGAVRPRAGRAKLLAIRDPAHYAAWVLAGFLRDHGVEIAGEPRARHLRLHEVPNATNGTPAPERSEAVLAERESPPLFEILKIINKDSQNLHAELVLREVGRVRRHVGSRAAGMAELEAFLAEAGVAANEYHFEDGSGLSRGNLVSPTAVVRLLSTMYLSAERDGWLDLLAVGGEDGTLQHRLRGTASHGLVMAKTGTLTGASALSGYVQTGVGDMLAFSVMVNNYDAPARAAREFIDQVVGELLEPAG